MQEIERQKADAKILQAIRDSVSNRIANLFTQKTASRPPSISLSQIGLCSRYVVQSVLTGITTNLTEATGVLAAGHLYENFIAEAFEGEEIIPQYEVWLAGVSGHIDFYFPNRNFFIECKTVAAARCSPDFLPVEHHVVQVHAYLSALMEMTNQPHIAALVYFPRENPRLFQVFTFAYDESWHSELVLRIELLKHAVETGKIPPIPADYRPDSFPCRWFSKISRIIVQCPFYDKCWEPKVVTAQSQQETAQEQQPETETFDLAHDLEEMVAVLYSLRMQRKSIEEQEKRIRAEILNTVKGKRGRFVGAEYGMTVWDETRRQLDTKALEKVVNLDEYRKEVKVTVVDVFKHA